MGFAALYPSYGSSGRNACARRHRAGTSTLEVIMRTTVNLDEGLLNEAQRLTGLTQRAALIQEGLKALIARESARRLALLGGSEPQIVSIPRRRPESR